MKIIYYYLESYTNNGATYYAVKNDDGDEIILSHRFGWELLLKDLQSLKKVLNVEFLPA